MHHRLRALLVGAVLACAAWIAVVATTASQAAAPHIPPCTISGAGHIQICPVAFRAVARKRAKVTVAKYADFSHCNFTPPSNETGENQNYKVASVTIRWGDGSTTSGVAQTGKTCPDPDGIDTDAGAVESVTGSHAYRKKGTYEVSVSITYIRGPGNTYPNCAKATKGDTTYNVLTNCIALNAPVESVAIVRK